jgi:hypothetical protein
VRRTFSLKGEGATQMLVPKLHSPQLSVETSLTWSANLGLRVGIRCLYGIKKHVF